MAARKKTVRKRKTRTKKKAGRPATGVNTAVATMRLPKELLARVDELVASINEKAPEHNASRNSIIKLVLEQGLPVLEKKHLRMARKPARAKTAKASKKTNAKK